jgi:TRAP-type C4-dicarboxylate transport system permease small subunit
MARGAVPTLADRVLDECIGPAVDWAAGLIVGGLVIMIGSGVLSRYFLNYSLAWSDELAGLFFVWLTFLGSVAACRRRTHMVIGFLPRGLGPRGQRVIGLYVLTATLVFLGFMVGAGTVLSATMLGDRSPVLRYPVGLSYLALPVAGGLMFAYTLREVWVLWQRDGGWTAVDVEEEG